jgi:hypothetical protein
MRYEASASGPKLSETELSEYALENDLELPEPLRQQLLEQNGGVPTRPCLVRLVAGGREEDVFSFLGIGMADPSAELAWMARTLAGRVPQGMIPFVIDSLGNAYLLEQVPPHRVWFWDHEREGEPSASTLAAMSLDDFMARLEFED